MENTKFMKKMAFAGPWITDREVEYVTEAARNGFYENATKYKDTFEKEVAEYLGVKHAVGTHCCTLALHLACATIGLKAGDEVIVTDHSWIATAYAVTYTGAKCVFVDIDPETLCIDPEKIEAAVTEKTKAIMMVHNFGIPARMDEIMTIAKKHHLRVIEDAAPALGAKYKGTKVGTIGDIGCFSFQGGKIGVSSEGGVLVTNDDALFERAELLASMGRTDRVWPFWSDEVGFQYTIGCLPAAMATIQLRRIDELVANKRRIYDTYREFLASNKDIKMCHELEGDFANYTYPSLWLSDEVKRPAIDIVNELKTYNIHCRPAFPQMSDFPEFVADKRFDNPISKKFQEKGIVLPAAHNLEKDDLRFIVDKLTECMYK